MRAPAAHGAGLRVEGLRKRYGPVAALDGLDVACAAGELLVVVGASGCGKTTLLRAIAGLEHPDAGRVLIGERDVTGDEPHRRGVAMVFQHYALYPDKTVADNIAFPLRMARVGRDERARRVAAAAALARVGDLLDRRPHELSGGQRQRVGIARAIVRGPAVLLMDEPLSNLDAGLRTEMRAELAGLQRALGATVVYVTHDQVEALSLADRLAVLDGGRLAQLGDPRAVFDRPASTFVASFLGGMNLLDGEVAGGALVVAGGGSVRLDGGLDVAPGKRVVLGVRPEHLALAGREAGRGGARLRGRVRFSELLGTEVLAHLAMGDIPVRARLPAGIALPEELELAAAAEHLHLFDPTTGLRIDANQRVPAAAATGPVGRLAPEPVGR